jgi:hypothetical protein
MGRGSVAHAHFRARVRGQPRPRRLCGATRAKVRLSAPEDACQRHWHGLPRLRVCAHHDEEAHSADHHRQQLHRLRARPPRGRRHRRLAPLGQVARRDLDRALRRALRRRAPLRRPIRPRTRRLPAAVRLRRAPGTSRRLHVSPSVRACLSQPRHIPLARADHPPGSGPVDCPRTTEPGDSGRRGFLLADPLSPTRGQRHAGVRTTRSMYGFETGYATGIAMTVTALADLDAGNPAVALQL